MKRPLVIGILVAILVCLFVLPPVASEDATTAYQKALDLFYKKNLEDALIECEKALSLNPKSNSAWDLKGNILDDMGRYQEALEAYNKAISLKPTSYISWNNKGNTLKHMVKYEEALEAYDESLRINPSYAYAYYNKGNLLSTMGRFEEAIKSLDSALSYDPHWDQAWYAKGLVYQKMDQHRDAVYCFDKAIAENSVYKEAYYQKGISYTELGQSAEAISSFSKALEIDPQYSDAKNRLNQVSNPNSTSGGDYTGVPGPINGIDITLLSIIVVIVAGVGAGVLLSRYRGLLPWKKPSSPDPDSKLVRNPESAETLVTRPGIGTQDVFISYSTQDKAVADAVCATLESRHIRCWIAPRDLLPGLMYQEGIIRAIEGSRIMVFIFSSHSNNSPHIIRELTKAVSSGVVIIPFRIEDVVPSKSMEYLIGAPHWLDALTPPLEAHIKVLADTVESLLPTLRKDRGPGNLE